MEFFRGVLNTAGFEHCSHRFCISELNCHVCFWKWSGCKPQGQVPAVSAFPLRQGLNAAERIKFGSQLRAEPRHWVFPNTVPTKDSKVWMTFRRPHWDQLFRPIRKHYVFTCLYHHWFGSNSLSPSKFRIYSNFGYLIQSHSHRFCNTNHQWRQSPVVTSGHQWSPVVRAEMERAALDNPENPEEEVGTTGTLGTSNSWAFGPLMVVFWPEIGHVGLHRSNSINIYIYIYI